MTDWKDGNEPETTQHTRTDMSILRRANPTPPSVQPGHRRENVLRPLFSRPRRSSTVRRNEDPGTTVYWDGFFWLRVEESGATFIRTRRGDPLTAEQKDILLKLMGNALKAAQERRR